MERAPDSPIEVLIFDDDVDTTRLLRDVLGASTSHGKSNCHVLAAKSLTEAKEIINSSHPDVILASLTSKANEILHAITYLKNCDGDTPIITIGSVGYEDIALDAVRRGAQDCFFRETLEPARLLHAIQYAIERRKITRDSTRLHFKQLAATIEAVSDGILIADANKNIVFANRSAEQILGTTEKELQGQAVPLPISPGSKVSHVLHHKDKDIHVEISATIVPWDQGEAGFCVTIRDVTEHKKLQLELQHAAKLKDEFIAHMSHELRTPMNGIIGMASLLEEKPLPPLLQGYVDTIRTSGETMLGLINDLLDLSKIEAGRVELEPSDFRVRSVVEDTLDLFAKKAKDKSIVVANILDPTIPRFLHGDATRLRQVLANLVSNAVRFTDLGSVVVRGQLDQKSTEGSVVLRFTVTDTGTGIPRERESSLFQPFSQLASDPKRKEGGTGLGLVIAKKLVELMGGEIGYSPAKPFGSEFWFTVALKPPLQLKNPGTRESLAEKKVLVVTDNEPLRAVLKEQLHIKSCAVTTLPRESLNEINANKFDLAIIESSDSTWRRCVQKIRLGVNASVPIILLSLRDEPLINLDALQYKVSSLSAIPLRQSSIYAFAADLTGSENQDDFATQEAGRQAKFSNPRDARIKARRILVAEDNVVNQRVAMSMLERLGVDADAVSDGREAIAAARSFAYDAILMDCRMPVIDGFEATKEIRLLSPHYEKIPIIAVTANASKSDIEKCRQATMNGHLSKPITLHDLRSALAEQLGSETEALDDFGNVLPDFAVACQGMNRSVLDSLRNVSSKLPNNLLEEVIDLFLANTPALFNDLKLAIAAMDAKEIESLAHKIKGSARNIGAASLAECCARLEHDAEHKFLDHADRHFQTMKIEFDRAALYLRKEFPKSSNEPLPRSRMTVAQ